MNSDAQDSPAPGLDVLEDALGYVFRERSLLETAVTHSSYTHENEGRESNERLEFLGDSVIGMTTANLLYRAHPDWPEGDLTRALHQLVDWRGLSSLARGIGLGAHLLLGRTEVRSKGHEKHSILADAMEAVIGAIYLDGGVAPVENFARAVFGDALAPEAPRVERDPKSRLNEWVMATFGVVPTYRILADTEIAEDEARYSVEVRIREHPAAQGVARSKQEAEQRAAAVAYENREQLTRTGAADE